MIRREVMALMALALVFAISMQEKFSIVIDYSNWSDDDRITITQEDEALEFNERGEGNDIWKQNHQDESSSSPREVFSGEIEPSKNSDRVLKSLWGKSRNATFERREKINHGIHVIMSFYKGSYSKDRFSEILLAMRRNLRNPYITAVHTLWEDRDPLDYINSTGISYKLIRVEFGVQPTYKDLFDYANLRLGRGAVAIVTNSDIHFDESLQCVVPITPDRMAFNSTKQHLVYALSRHPYHPCIDRIDYCEEYTGSHDAFVFALPLPAGFSRKVDFTQNNIAAENVVIWEMKRLAGYIIKNPCYTIRAYHIHCTNQRNYEKGSISRGPDRIGDIDRHGVVMSTSIKCGQVLY